MTIPSIVFFGYDEIPKSTPKVFLPTLLYSTATQGQVIEGMHVILRYPRGGDRVYGFWGYDEGSKLVPGGGWYVGCTGVAANHHFVQSVHEGVRAACRKEARAAIGHRQNRPLGRQCPCPET